MTLLAQTVRYGFFGLRGMLGVLLGFFVWLVVAWGVYSIFDILANKFGKPEIAWLISILKIVLQVIIALWFIQLIFQIF